ncbi:MAG: hypothetical protein WAT67_08405 [Candidatus Contendobacter sp.]
MRMRLNGLKRYFELFLLVALLAGWSGASVGGGFIGANSTVSISITADKTTLPLNIMGYGPLSALVGPYLNTVTVLVKKRDGKLFAAPGVTISVVSGLASGSLYYLDGDPDHETCLDNQCPPGIAVPNAYRRLAFEDTDGVVTGHFIAGNVPGTVVLTATAQDPDTGKTISASLTLNVTGGGNPNNPPGPSSVNFTMDPAPVYIRNNPQGTTAVTQNTVKIFQIFVKDDFGQPLQLGAGSALRVELLPNRPNGGEWLSAIAADGTPQQGSSVVSGLFGGAATLALHSGNLPGTVVISATADRADNNVDNGIQMAITNYAMVSIGTGEITSLTFTGPFAGAVFAGANNLVAVSGVCGATPCDSVWNGVYSRVVSVVASDPFGNPPPEGTPITFRLIDSPLDMLKNRYPDQGHGQFAITGTTGDPQEGGYAFFAPNRKTLRVPGDTLNPFVVPNGVSLALANPLCVLMLQDPEVVNPNDSTVNALPAEGRPEYHVGSRIITGRQGNMLTVNAPFNQVSQNVGANVWYAVGCPPHKGNVANAVNEVVVMTNASGAADTVMNYPASQVGRRFMMAAESNGGKVGAAMTHWYLGVSDDSILTITSPGNLAQQILLDNPITATPWPPLVKATLEVVPGQPVSQPVTLQLLDGGILSGGALRRTGVPGVPIGVEIVINDPAETAAIRAEEAMAKAQIAFDTFVAANPGVCDLKDPEDPTSFKDPEKCAKQKALAAALDDAKIAAAETRAIANLHTPAASVIPTTLASSAGGFVNLVLQVDDLPADGSVDFYFSTVGPDVRSQTLQITVQPPAPPEG